MTYEGIGWQSFLVSGRMIYRGAEAPSGSSSPGEWRVQDDSLCSRWQPGGEWECYRVEIDGQGGIRFIDAYGNISAGRFRVRSCAGFGRVITLAELEGHWTLTRRIDDRRAGLTGSAHRNLPLAARCRRIGAGGDRARFITAVPRRSAPNAAISGGRWASGWPCFFEDGRPIYDLAPGRLSTRHDCAPDTYDVTYVFDGSFSFSTTWRVTGPRKDQFIHSTYTRP